MSQLDKLSEVEVFSCGGESRVAGGLKRGRILKNQHLEAPHGATPARHDTDTARRGTEHPLRTLNPHLVDVKSNPDSEVFGNS